MPPQPAVTNSLLGAVPVCLGKVPGAGKTPEMNTFPASEFITQCWGEERSQGATVESTGRILMAGRALAVVNLRDVRQRWLPDVREHSEETNLGIQYFPVCAAPDSPCLLPICSDNYSLKSGESDLSLKLSNTFTA